MALFLGEMLTATAMGYFEDEIERAVVLSLFIPLIISSGGNSGSQATSLIIRALALREVRLGDWWRVAMRELPAGLALGVILGVIGFTRIVLWQSCGLFNYGPHACWSRRPWRLRWLASWASAPWRDRCCHSCFAGWGSTRPAPQLRLWRRWWT